MKQNLYEKLWLFILVVLAIVAQVFSWTSGHNWGGDFSQYIMQTISLAEGTVPEFIIRNGFTVNNSSFPIGPVSYPWGFPILLTPIYILFGFDIIAFKGVVLLFFSGFLVILWFLFEKELVLTDRIIFVAFFAFNPMFLQFGDNVLSDTPFLFFSTFSFLIFSKLHKAKSRYALYWLSFLLGLSFAASTAIRTNGILLPFTYTAMLFLLLSPSFLKFNRIFRIQWLSISETRPMHKFFIYLLPLVIFTVSLLFLGKLIPDYQVSHLGHFKHLTIRSIFSNVFYYGQLIKDFFGYIFPVNFIFYLLSIPLLFFGLRKKWHSSTPILIYVILTLVLYIIWPSRQGLRFLFPVLPFYLYFVFIGFSAVTHKYNYFSIRAFRRISLTRTRVMSAVLVILIFQSSWLIYKNVLRERDGGPNYGPYTNDAKEMFTFVRQNVQQNEVVVFIKPRVMRLFTDRDSVYYDNISDFKYRQWFVIEKDSSIYELKEDLFSIYPASLEFENTQFQVFKFK